MSSPCLRGRRLKRGKTSTDREQQERGEMWRLWLPLRFFYPLGTCRMIFTADLFEIHTSRMTSCKDSLTSYIQHAVKADDKTFHMSLCVIWGKKTVIDYLNGAKKKAGTHQGTLLIEMLCGNVFISSYDFSNNLPMMSPSFSRNGLMQHVREDNSVLAETWCFEQQELPAVTSWGTTMLYCLLSGCMLRSLFFILPFSHLRQIILSPQRKSSIVLLLVLLGFILTWKTKQRCILQI